MKALVTGVPGWLGTRLVETLRSQDREVRCIALPLQDTSTIELLGAEVVRADLKDAESLKGVCDGITSVFHCAGLIHPKKIKELYDINTNGTQNIIEEAIRAGVGKFIYVSSNSVGGLNKERTRLMIEEDPPQPYMNYGASKFRAEEIVTKYQREGEIRTTIIRPCWFYGVGQPARQTRFFRMIKSGKPIMFGAGTNLRSMSYVDNVVQGLLLSEEKDIANGKTYWIADKRPYETIEIYRTVAKILNVTLTPRFVPGIISEMCLVADTMLQAIGLYSPEVHVAGEMNKNIACSIEKAQSELGYSPEVDLEEGMRRSIRWCNDNGMEI